MRTLSTSTGAKLFGTGFIVGPIVDSLHNQCLLRYDVLPISLGWPIELQQNQNALVDIVAGGSTSSDLIAGSLVNDASYFFCSSWTVPPLLGFAYVILGGLLPRVVESILPSTSNQKLKEKSSTTFSSIQSPSSYSSSRQLRTRAILAVTTTAMIIKLSEFLETHPGIFDNYQVLHNQMEPASLSLLVMTLSAIFQWALLDRSIAALLVATAAAIGGPVTELPFVGHGIWTYTEQAANYFPLQSVTIDNSLILQISQILLGTSNYQDLALSSITGPCYFAVTMDAIALGRWFDTSTFSSLSMSLSETINFDDNKI